MSELVEQINKGSATRRRFSSVTPAYVGSVGLTAQSTGFIGTTEVSLGPALVQPGMGSSRFFVSIATHAARPPLQRAPLERAPLETGYWLSHHPYAPMSEPSSAVPEIRTPTYIGISPPESASEPTKPNWWAPVIGRVREIASLPSGWDSYGAARVDRRNIVRALNFLIQVVGGNAPVPNIVALPDGGLQLEWHRGGMDVEVEFSEGVDQGLYFRQAGTEWEGPTEAGFDEFSIAQRLVGD